MTDENEPAEPWWMADGISDKNLTKEEARKELDDFIQKIDQDSVPGLKKDTFTLDENIVVEESPRGPMPSEEQVRRYREEAARQAAMEVGEVSDIDYSVEDAVQLVRAQIKALNAALRVLGSAMKPRSLPDVLEDSVVDA